jgi:phosphohistidine swiveling domain-containing protein
VILNLSTLPQIEPGNILIATYIPTSWTPILPTLAGVVLEYGSPGDHPSITAREFGVPVICSTLHATKLIPNGAWVSLDAATGQVTWNITPIT